MATAVGVNILRSIAPIIAAGLRRRWENGRDGPFNIIICENLINANKLLGGWICEHLDKEEGRHFHKAVGLVEASIGRMIPFILPKDRAKDPLWVRVERYAELPVDAEAIKGKLPHIDGLHPVSPFAFYIRRKLFLHNMSHALIAYVGALQGYEYIWQAAGDAYIKLLAGRAMLESAAALSKTYGLPMEEMLDHISDLLLRYENRALGDTVARVGGDLYRKLGAQDRLAGTAAFCCEAGIDPIYISAGLAAALFFIGPSDDQGTVKMREMLEESGSELVLRMHSGLVQCTQVLDYTARYSEAIHSGQGPYGLLKIAEMLSHEGLSRKRVI